MVNRKRYYNSFFDQINEYKSKQPGEHGHTSKYFGEQVLGVGLVGALAVAFFSGNYIVNPASGLSGNNGAVAYYRQESRPAFQFFNQLTKADQSFARELDGNNVWPSADAYTTGSQQKSTGREEILLSGGGVRSKSFLRFDLSSLKSKDDLVLKLYPAGDFSGTVSVNLLPSDELWEEDLLTADSAPLSGGVAVAKAQGKFSAGSSIDFDLKDTMKDSAFVNLLIDASGSNSGFSFYARESSQPPVIVSVK